MNDNKIVQMNTLRAAADVTGLSYDALRKMCLRNQIAHIRVGKKFLVNMDFLLTYLSTAGLNNGETE